MKRYSGFQPTGFDPAGLNGERLGVSQWWVVGVSQTRDSGVLERSNFAVMLRELGGESDTVQVHRFGHWGPGWFEIILIDPADEASVKAAEELEAGLEDYPVLDESHWSELEFTEACEAWARMRVKDRVEYLQRYGRRVSVFAARREELPEGIEELHGLVEP